ncbi:hypothetical protein BIV57_09130 [Mangrovactinospora gilvigrisea]|uniref:histidine kinase n=1 Tax=Mangrovactinospora gilvigrisea TaxID=1428644 RepID=A0A1J7C881_9ACTN|nr:HAMP domain-containing sensor histidine kinase [Mangrovactinospora gilvigrisea]OIV37732.1 hypothetical protein BIV57_09130 [Mangrovactinospora gilvigrisea]
MTDGSETPEPAATEDASGSVALVRLPAPPAPPRPAADLVAELLTAAGLPASRPVRLPAEERRAAVRLQERFRREGGAGTYRLALHPRMPSGKVLRLHLALVRPHGDLPDSPGYAATLDLTAAYDRMAASRRNLLQLLDALPLPVLLTRSTWTVEGSNPAFRELPPIRALAPLLPGSDAVPVLDALAAVTVEPPDYRERIVTMAAVHRRAVLESRTADGRDHRLLRYPYRLTTGEAASVWVVQDITEQRARQRALAEQHAADASRIREHTEFLAAVSHDLRTPLTGLISAAELLEDPATGPLNGPQRQLAEAVARTAVRLDSLLTDLILVARAERPVPTSPIPLDLAATVAGTALDLIGMGSGPAPFLVVDIPPGLAARADPLRVHQVLDNLLDNAFKYAPAESIVRVALETREDFAVLTVADHGIGIPAEDLDRVLDGFQRAGNTRGILGTGLGLAIARRITEAHGGILAVDSTEGAGTTVTVALPLAGPDSPRNEAP